MKKIIGLIIVFLLVLTGCNNSESSNGKSVGEAYKVKDVSFKFDKDTTFHDFSYKNAEGLEPDESKYAVYLTYENKDIYDGRFVFRIVMDYQENTTLDDVTDAPKKYDTKNINGIAWKTYKNTTNNTDVIVYVTERNNNLYVVNVMKYSDADGDIDSLADIFMSGVKLK